MLSFFGSRPASLSHCDRLLRLLYFVEVDVWHLSGLPMKDQTPWGVPESNMLVQPLFSLRDMINAIESNEKSADFIYVLSCARELADRLAQLSVTQWALLLTLGLSKVLL